MATSDAEIATLAIRLLGDTKNTVSDLQNDNTPIAKMCRAVYETARDEMMRDFDWRFLRRRVILTLVEEDPNAEWGKSYRYPPEALAIRRIPSGIRETREDFAHRIEYEIGSDVTGLLIYTDQDDAEAEITILEEDEGRYPADFVMALAYRLASYIAPQVTQGDPNMTERMLRMFMLSVQKAKSNAENERRPGPPPESDMITARGGM